MQQTLSEITQVYDLPPLDLDLTRDGRPKSTVHNLHLMCRSALVERLAYNTLSRQIEYTPEGQGPRALSDADLVTICLLLHSVYGADARPAQVYEVVQALARDAEYHPVARYLGGLVWDGTPRLATLLSEHLGAVHTPLCEIAATRWCVSAVARALCPGASVHAMLILQGPQGSGKSQFFEILGGEWYSDSEIEIGTDKATERIHGVWIHEFGELEAFSRADWNAIKQFVSRSTDRWRAPYGRIVEALPRSVVFGGTTNDREFLSDPTGNRRFMAVGVGVTHWLDRERLLAVRDQIWAEAVALYTEAGGEPSAWHLTPEEVASFGAASEQYRVTDAWEEVVIGWLTSPTQAVYDDFSVSEILAGALEFKRSQMGHRDQIRVTKILKTNGWTKIRKGTGNFWSRPKKP